MRGDADCSRAPFKRPHIKKKKGKKEGASEKQFFVVVSQSISRSLFHRLNRLIAFQSPTDDHADLFDASAQQKPPESHLPLSRQKCYINIRNYNI